MRGPQRLRGNRILGADGATWAVWRVTLPTYAFLADDAKLGLHARVRDALVALPDRAHLLSTCRPVDRGDLARAVSRATTDVAAPRWPEVVAPDLAALAAARPTQRRTYVAARLSGPRPRTVLDAAMTGVAAWFGTPGPPPARREDEVAARRAAELGARLRRSLDLVAVTPEEVRGLHRHAVLRGLLDRAPARPGTRDRVADDAVLWEGGRADDPDRPRHRRYLRVDTEHGTAYQTTLVVAEMPAAFTYPGGGEWFGAADLVDFPVDWSARITAVPNAEARHRAKRQQRQLTAQHAEYEGEPAGPPRTLAAALEGIDDQQAALTDNPGDPELQVTVAFTVAARTLAQLEARATALADVLEPWGYALHRPTGGQVALHVAALPGTTTPRVCEDYVQHLLPRDLAAGVPFAATAVGDPQGVPIGVTAATAQPSPVLLDPAHGPATNRSGSMGVFGALGSGKSYFVKRLLLGTVARGGRVVVLDRTAAGEYVALARAAVGRVQVVRLDADADIGLDPLQVLRGEEAVRTALGFLTTLTRTTPTDVDGAVLSQAVRRVAAAGGRLADVLPALDAQDDPEAHGLRRKLAAHADHPMASLVFAGDADRAALALDADLVVFHAPGLALPDRDALVHEHLARQLLPEQVFGQALLYLVAAVARQLAFADPGRFGATLVDEAWALTASPQGRQLLLDSVRDGRKHNAAVWVLSQHPEDLGDDALSHLLGVRVLFRQGRGAAPAALRFLGLPPQDALVDLLADHLQTGQCLLRDVTDRVGLVTVLPAAEPSVQQALDTTPAGGAGQLRGAA